MAEDDSTPNPDLEAEVSRRTRSLELECMQKTKLLLDSQSQLVQAEKMAALGNLAAGLAHEINTPLGAISSSNEILEGAFEQVRDFVQKQSQPPDAKARMADVLSIIEESVQTSRLACERLVRIVRNVRDFARLDEGTWAKADIHGLVESTLILLNHELKGRVTIVKEFGHVRPLDCYPNQLNQVLLNLLVNAAQSVEGTGEIRIKTCEEGDSLHISITDNGRGMTPEIKARIFDPGFTTKRAGLGTGLGLPICLKIIQNHHGRIDVESTPGRGSTFDIVLPIAQRAERKKNGE
jgi:two-component system, NtrC family, sensor kinase